MKCIFEMLTKNQKNTIFVAENVHETFELPGSSVLLISSSTSFSSAHENAIDCKNSNDYYCPCRFLLRSKCFLHLKKKHHEKVF